MKIAFLGSAEFSKIVLQELNENSNNEVVCVVTNLDKQSGRGQKIKFSPVKDYAMQNNIPVLQFSKVSLEGYDQIKAFNPDALVTASFGQILKQNILDLAPYGVINVHSSLLPQYRGSCPINWVLINGETKTGVTIMKTNIGLDTGDMILKEEVELDSKITAGELTLKLADVGAKLLVKALEKIENNTATYTKQNDSQSSYYPMLNKQMGKIDFNKSNVEVVNLVRGLNPWPVCFVNANISNQETILKVYSASVYELPSEKFEEIKTQNFKPGQVVLSSAKRGLIVKCGSGFVSLNVIQAQNSKPMQANAYLNGKVIPVGTMLNG